MLEPKLVDIAIFMRAKWQRVEDTHGKFIKYSVIGNVLRKSCRNLPKSLRELSSAVKANLGDYVKAPFFYPQLPR